MRRAKEGTVEFENARCIRKTDAAILVKLETENEPVWFPQSTVDEDSEVWKAGDEGRLIVSESIATAKGLV